MVEAQSGSHIIISGQSGPHFHIIPYKNFPFRLLLRSLQHTFWYASDILCIASMYVFLLHLISTHLYQYIYLPCHTTNYKYRYCFVGHLTDILIHICSVIIISHIKELILYTLVFGPTNLEAKQESFCALHSLPSLTKHLLDNCFHRAAVSE